MENEVKEKKKRKKMKKGFKILILILLILLLSGVLGYIVWQDKKDVPKEEEEVVEEEVIEEDDSKYKLASNPTKYQEKLNEEINELVESEEYTELELAELVAKNFIAEYYTLSNTETNTPGGLQYIPTELHERFKDFASYVYDFYNYYENRDELYVTDIVVTSTKTITYTYDDDLDEISTKKNLSGFDIKMSWSYKNGDNAKTIVKVVKWNDEYGIVKVQN